MQPVKKNAKMKNTRALEFKTLNRKKRITVSSKEENIARLGCKVHIKRPCCNKHRKDFFSV